MIFFFDNNLPACLAHGVRELSSAEWGRHQILHLKDRFPSNITDSEWIDSLSREREQVVVITQDKLNKANEAIILRESGLVVFHLDKGWASQPYWTKAHNFVRWWPHIVRQAERIDGAATFRVKWRCTEKFEQIRLK